MRRIYHSPWVFFGFLAALAISGLSCIANAVSGAHLTTDPTYKPIFAFASVSIDIFEFCLVFAVAGAWNRSKYVAAGVSLILLCLCLTWSMKSAADFVSASFSGVLVDRENQGVALQSKRDELTALVAGQKGLLAMSANDDIRRSDRQEAAKRHDTNAKRIEALRSDVASGSTAAAAYPLASALGISGERLNMIQAALFATILKLGATFGFWCMARASDPPPRAARKPSVIRNVWHALHNASYPKIAALSEPEAEPMKQPGLPHNPQPEKKSNPPSKSNIISLRERLMKAKTQEPEKPVWINDRRMAETTRFIAENLVDDKESTISAAEIFDRYNEWCEANNIAKRLSPNWLGTHLKERWRREIIRKYTYYHGVALKPPTIIIQHNSGDSVAG